MKLAGGQKDQGIVIGNVFDKYGSGNPLVRRIMRGFEENLAALVTAAGPVDIHEVGCGEGYWILRWNEQGIAARGCDFSQQVIDLARQNAIERGLDTSLFETRSIYELDPVRDRADLVVCCEVLEHLKDPEAALEALRRIVGRHLILSVPWEPTWRVLNMARGKYLARMGNTPGHLQHWSRRGFVTLVSRYFDVVEVRRPLPWTMLLCQPRD